MTAYTKHLEDHERDTFAACGLIVIDPELCGRCRHRTAPPGMVVACDNMQIPEGWRILTEPCSGWQRASEDARGNYAYLTLDPDCVGGRRVVTLTATCPHEHATTIVSSDPLCGDWQCPDCGADDGSPDGKVTLGRFTIPALLPVYERPSLATVYPCVTPLTVDPDGRTFIAVWTAPATEDSHNMTIEQIDGPLPRPGQFIARPEAVE